MHKVSFSRSLHDGNTLETTVTETKATVTPFVQLHRYNNDMSFSDRLAPIKKWIKQEVRRKRPWQSYVVAVALSWGFLLTLGVSFAEPRPPEEPHITWTSNRASKPEVQRPKVQDYHLSSQTPSVSNWQLLTETTAAPSQAEPTQPVGPTETPTQKTAGLAAEAFYSAINAGDIENAYGFLTPEFQKALPYSRFQTGYQGVEALACTIKYEEVLSPGRVRLDLQLDVVEAGVPATYFVTCVLHGADDEWAVAGMSQLRV
jgi:hypothetical protein